MSSNGLSLHLRVVFNVSLFAKFGPKENFFEKSGSVIFVPLWILDLMQKIRKIVWANSEKRELRTNGRTEGQRWIYRSPPARAGWPIITVIINQRKFLPIHSVPFPSNPGLHWHTWLPCTFVHVAFAWHPWLVVLHSFLSIAKNKQ